MAMELETERRNRMTTDADEVMDFMAQHYPDKQVQGGHDSDDLWGRLARVQRDLRAPKNQKNTFGGYDYRSAEDILEAVKPLLAREGLAMTMADSLENVGDRYYVKATVAVVALDTPQMTQVTAYAREEETKKGMDASQITGSASSYARKYALNGMFLIDDTKDADTNEHRHQQERRQSAPPRQSAPEEGATGSPRHETPRQGSAHDTPAGSAQRPNTDAGQFDAPQPGTGGPATKPQKGRLWHMSGKDDSVVAAWAAEYGETLDTLTKGTASLLIDTKGE